MATAKKTSTTAKTTNTKTMKTKTPASVTPETITETIPTTVDITSLSTLKIHGFPVVGTKILPHRNLNRAYNVRSAKNAEKVSDIVESITKNGVTAPIHVTPNNVTLDGFRRLNACDIAATALGQESVDVPVIIVDVPEKDIPLYQHRCGLAKGVSEKEHIQAIIEYAVRNPKAYQEEIAKQFAVSVQTVSKAIRLHREAPGLYVEVTKGTLAQKAALDIIQVAKREKLQPDDLGKKVIDAIVDKITPPDATENVQPKKPITKKLVDKMLVAMNIEPNSETNEEKETKTPKLNAKKLLKELWTAIHVSGTGANLQISGTVDKDLLDKIEQICNSPTDTEPATAKGNLLLDSITLKSVNPDEFYSLWLDREQEDTITLLKYDSTFYCYEDAAKQISDIVGEPLVSHGGLDVFRTKNSKLTDLLLAQEMNIAVLEIRETKTKKTTKVTETQPKADATPTEPAPVQDANFTLQIPVLQELIEQANQSSNIVATEDIDVDDSDDLEDELEEIATDEETDDNTYASLFG